MPPMDVHDRACEHLVLSMMKYLTPHSSTPNQSAMAALVSVSWRCNIESEIRVIVIDFQHLSQSLDCCSSALLSDTHCTGT